MAHSRWTVTPYAAALAAVLALGACSGGGGAPAATPAGPATSAVSTTAAGPTTTSAPTTEDPALARIPAAARPETMDGAAAYAAFYLRQLNEASKAGNPAVLEGLAKSSCSMCGSFYKSVSSLKALGQRHDGDTLKVLEYEPLSFTRELRTVYVKVELLSVPIVDSAGKRLRNTEADSGGFVATLSFDRRWYISRLQVAK